MRLTVLLVTLMSTALADESVQRTARAPQGHIKYDDPNGLKVNWKFFAPHNQWRSQLESSQRSQRAESDTAQHPQARQQPRQAQHQPPATAEAEPNQQYYKPYSAVPIQIRQLLEQAYEPQRPYVDQSAFLYSTSFAAPQQYNQQLATAESASYEQASGRHLSTEQQKFPSRRDYGERGRKQGRIDYKEDYDQQQQQQRHQVGYVPVPFESTPAQSLPKLVLDKNMPSEIQQLLQYQAQIPYDVIANRIIYKPKSMFIPKPLPDDVKGPHYYRSKIYYLKDDDYEPEYETGKQVDEQRQH